VDRRTVVLVVGPGRVRLGAANVLRIERGRTPLTVYRDRASRLDAGDVQGWLDLGFWAHEAGLATQSKEAFERVLQIDPRNASANAALGRVELNGRYVSQEESYRQQGFVQHRGQWVSPAQLDAELRAEAAEAEASALRREGEIRVREAEARARIAEAEARRAEADAENAEDFEDGIPLWWGTGGPAFVEPPFLPPPDVSLPPDVPPNPPPHRIKPPRQAPPRHGPSQKGSTAGKSAGSR
jgi:hypothetical protein